MDTATIGNALNGVLSPSGAPVSTVGVCDVAAFMVINPGGRNPPVICGQNSGEHSEIN